jgi:hypothetical protein
MDIKRYAPHDHDIDTDWYCQKSRAYLRMTEASQKDAPTQTYNATDEP